MAHASSGAQVPTARVPHVVIVKSLGPLQIMVMTVTNYQIGWLHLALAQQTDLP